MIAGIHRAVEPDSVDLESDLALVAVVGRGMKATDVYKRQECGTAYRPAAPSPI